jgi:hypothetical protein
MRSRRRRRSHRRILLHRRLGKGGVPMVLWPFLWDPSLQIDIIEDNDDE